MLINQNLTKNTLLLAIALLNNIEIASDIISDCLLHMRARRGVSMQHEVRLEASVQCIEVGEDRVHVDGGSKCSQAEACGSSTRCF